MNAKRIIYLKNLDEDTQVKYSEVHEKFLVENRRRVGLMLTAPVLRWSISRGVHLIDNDPTGEYVDDVLYTSTRYARLRKGEIP